MSRSFQKPEEDDYLWKSDKQDVDQENNTTFVFNNNPSLNLEEQRARLPIAKYKIHVLYLLEKFQTLVLVGETGCGKSTQVPQYLLEAGWCGNGLKIGITEPRRFCATSLAQRVAKEQHCELGDKVGYSIRFDDCQDLEKTKIKYMTEGILVREMMADPLLRQYSVIILDEVHERTLYTDVVMGLLKKILKKRTKLRLVVASATVDATKIMNFFNNNTEKDETKNTATILSVQGRLHPVTVHYLKEPVSDYVTGCVDTVVKIHEKENQGDILVFLTGFEEVDRAVSVLKEHGAQSTRKDLKLLVVPMYGSLPNSEQLKVFRATPRGMRKVVVATNIAETSITIPGVVYVVDSGFVKLRWFNCDTCNDALIIIPTSQASAIQRAGRAGRVKPGKVYRLYRESDYESLPLSTPPEMQRSDLSSAVLNLKALGIENVLRFSFPSPPPAQNLLLALELLYALEAIDKKGQLTKPLGTTMAEFPLPPLHSKAIINAGKLGCTDEISTILSMLQVENIFKKPYTGSDAIKIRVQKRNFEVAEGDMITMLNVYNSYRNIKEEHVKSWCGRYYINYKSMRRVTEIKTQMLKLLQRFDIQSTTCNDVNAVCRCLVTGFFPNVAYLHYSGVYKTIRGHLDLYIHPTSVIYSLQQPQWVLYNELIHTNKLFMKDLTVIESSWLQELAPHYYHRA